MKIIKSLPVWIGAVFILSACGYQGNPQVQQHVYPAQIQTVQTAVNEYHKDTGVLPIQTRNQQTPIYKKYPIDFNRLLGKYLPNEPQNAYSNGGIFEYVLVNAEKNPKVKVADLQNEQTLQDLQTKIDFFRYSHHFTPIGKIIVPKRYTVDYKKLGYHKPPYVTSPFTGHQLGFVIGPDSKVHIDYRKDLYAFMKKYHGSFNPGEDIRHILVEHSPFVPIDSFAYTVNSAGDPVFLIK